ncbi:hypothetical protein [Actinoplanes palleronii]|uniref:hypothetical protein n=1 Tax=Actinoplanes palleronii TaxID=113570 RepID=UPI001944AC57|nr:hypothetical protein [Actinoplanes palleronii]
MSKRWWIAATSAAALAAALIVAVGSPDNPDETIVLVGDSHHRGGPLYFELKGKPVRGLFPGAVKQMKISVVNPLGYRITVHRLTAKVSDTDRRGCSATAANLQVRSYSGRLPVTVAASGRTELGGAIPVSMPIGATRKCAGARFTIAISGVGQRVPR